MDERPVRRGGPREFEDLMTRGERLAAGVYLPVHSVLMPLVLSALSVMSAGALDNLTLNAIMYSAGTLFTLLFLHKFLRRSFDVLAENLSQCVLTLFSALAMDFALSWLLSLVLALFGIVLGSNANNDAVVGLALEGHNRMFAITVFLAPMAEEPLFRGCSSAACAGTAARRPTSSPFSCSASTTSGSTCSSSRTGATCCRCSATSPSPSPSATATSAAAASGCP